VRVRDIRLRGPRVTIRPLREIDLDIMSTWAAFDDPLYRFFDWPRHAFPENDIWFTELLRDQTRVYYAVDNEEEVLIGRISLRQIQGRESARLGIGFGTDFVSQGYGTEALRVFLRYYFLDLGFRKMVLDVAAINQRAVRCYESCGFERVGTHYQYLGQDYEVAFIKQKPYRHLRQFVRRKGRRNYVLAYDMALAREDWLVQACSLEPEAL
jgi:RimJ/RimL family protein N-acetyltransferase